jgi:hypothetical protein
MNDTDHNEKLGIKPVLKSLSIFIIFIAVTFIAAGRLNYW